MRKEITTKLLYFLVIFVFILHLFPKKVFAYIDPGSGSYLGQIILAAALSTAVMIKFYWKKIGSFFNKIFSKSKRDNDQENSS